MPLQIDFLKQKKTPLHLHRKILFIVSFLLLHAQFVVAQFSDSVHHLLQLNATGSLNSVNREVTYLLNNTMRYGLRYRNIAFNSTTNYVYGNTPTKLTNNDLRSALDFNVLNTKIPKLYFWGLGNYTASHSLNILYQWQLGAGAAYKFLEYEEHLFLSLSSGILFETSNIIQPDATTLPYQTFRNSTRLQFRYQYKSLLTFNTSAFYQPSLNYKDDYILLGTATAGLKIWKWLTFTTTFNYNYISRTDKENMLLTYGLVFEKYF